MLLPTFRIRFSTLYLLLLLPTAYCLLPTSPARAADPPAPTTQPTQAALEAAFSARMSNVVLTGQYTIGNSPPKTDRYTLVSARKLNKDDNWLFQARIQFAGKDITIPMIIPVKWAGDTPVISVTDLGFPGLGNYTARVMIFGDQYAGTWQDTTNKAHGGHLWGKLEKLPATQPATTRPVVKP